MRTVSLAQVTKNIDKNKKEVNAKVQTAIRSNGRRKKSRTRSPGEVEALNEISVARWEKAVKEGKVIKLGERSMYYDHRII